MYDILKGAVILTTSYHAFGFYICPSNYKHGGIYFGKGLKDYLEFKNIKYKNINNYDNYVIHNNGHYVVAEEITKFYKNRDEVVIYYYNDLISGIDSQIMSIAANKSCDFLGSKFSFFSDGSYCFEIIIKSYIYAVGSVFIPTISIVNHSFYNSKSITDSNNFKLVIKKHKESYKRYYASCKIPNFYMTLLD